MTLKEVEEIVDQCIANYLAIQDLLEDPEERYETREGRHELRKRHTENAMLLARLGPLIDAFGNRSFNRGSMDEDIFEYCQTLTNRIGTCHIGIAIQRLRSLTATLRAKAMGEGNFDLDQLDTPGDVSDCEDALKKLHAQIASETSVFHGTPYYEDLTITFAELLVCYRQDCRIAVLCLSGKLLEVALKTALLARGVAFDDNWMIGTLIKKVRESLPDYIDPTLGNIANIINTSRIPAVHCKTKVPIPSHAQMNMVVYAVIDIMTRAIADRFPGTPALTAMNDLSQQPAGGDA